MADMAKTFDMPPDIEAQWEPLYSKARTLNEAGDSDAAIDAALQAWSLIPEPRMRCSVTHITLFRLEKLYLHAKRYSAAAALADTVMRDSPFERSTVPVFAVQKGIALFESGDVQAARAAFDVAWSSTKDLAFKGEDPKYLSFYLAQ